MHFKISSLIYKIKRKRFDRGVTPIIATILILALVVAGVAIGFVQIIPYIERSKVETDAASIQSSLIEIDNMIWDMISNSAGSYIPDSFPSRQLQITIPIGTLSTNESRNNVSYEPVYCTGNCTQARFNTSDTNYAHNTLGVLSHSFSSNYVLLPENTLEYLTGSNPYQRRDAVSVSDLTSSISDEQSATNISLYRIGYDHYIELSYRPKIFITQTIVNGIPTCNVNIYLIKILGSTSFIGTTNMFLKYQGDTIKQITRVGYYNTTSPNNFYMVMSVNNANPSFYAYYQTAPGGFTTNYVVTVTTHTFSISG